MRVVKERMLLMWDERKALIVRAQRHFDDLRMQHALKKGDREGAERFARRTGVKKKVTKKLVRHCKYYYNKILEVSERSK